MSWLPGDGDGDGEARAARHTPAPTWLQGKAWMTSPWSAYFVCSSVNSCGSGRREQEQPGCGSAELDAAGSAAPSNAGQAGGGAASACLIVHGGQASFRCHVDHQYDLHAHGKAQPGLGWEH